MKKSPYEIRLTNKTNYSTKHLKAFIEKGLHEYNREYGWESIDGTIKSNKHLLVLEVKYRTPKQRLCGYAYYRTRVMKLMVLKDGNLDIKQLGMFLWHELRHCDGLKHKHMAPDSTYKTEWTEGMEIPYVEPVKVIKLKPTAQDKVAHLNELKARWEKKLRMAQNKIDKLNLKITYYTKKAAKNVTI